MSFWGCICSSLGTPGLDGQVIRASASGAVDLGLIPSLVKPMTLQLVLTASLLDAQEQCGEIAA